MEKIRRPSILEVNIFYLVLAISLLFIGSTVQSREIYKGLLITEYVLVLIPSLLFLLAKGISLKESLRLNRLGLKNALLIIIITIFSYLLVVFSQAVFLGIISFFKEVSPAGVPVPMDDMQYLYSFFVIAISPGICEEVMFRGTIMYAYEKLGKRKSIIISAILFAMFHFTILNFIGPLILGIIFGIMVHKTNSIFASIIGHTVNNGIAISILYGYSKFADQIDDIILEENPGVVDSLEMGGSILFIILILGFCAFVVTRLMKKLKVHGEEKSYLSNLDEIDYIDYGDRSYESKSKNFSNYIPIIIGLIIFIYVNYRFILV